MGHRQPCGKTHARQARETRPGGEIGHMGLTPVRAMRLIPFILVLSLLTGCIPFPHTSLKCEEVRGRVLDAETHTPIKGAKVYLVVDDFSGNTDKSRPEHVTYTDATGSFRLGATHQFHLAVVAVEGDNDFLPKRKYYEGRILHPDYSSWRFDVIGWGGSGKDYGEIFLKPKVRIAVGMPLTEVVSSVRRLGGADITSAVRLPPTPKYYGHIHDGIYWRVDSYNAYITISSENGKVVRITYLSQRDYDNALSVAEVEQSVLALKFDDTERSVEKTK